MLRTFFLMILTLISVSACQTPKSSERYEVLRQELNARFPVSYIDTQPITSSMSPIAARRGRSGLVRMLFTVLERDRICATACAVCRCLSIGRWVL